MSHALTPLIFIIDDDTSVRQSLEQLILSIGCRLETFASAKEFLACPRSAVPCCLILDLDLPGLNGLELQERVAGDRFEMPIIFLSGQGDIRMTVRAMKCGAFEFLTKPFDGEVLVNTIRQAIKRSEAVLNRETELQVLREDFGSLTPREREVMTLVVAGLLNKQVGGELGISEITVKAHRGNVMRKMKADSLAALVKMAARLRLTQTLATVAVQSNSPAEASAFVGNHPGQRARATRAARAIVSAPVPGYHFVRIPHPYDRVS
jgi:FixJ family two-component response regulator